MIDRLTSVSTLLFLVAALLFFGFMAVTVFDSTRQAANVASSTATTSPTSSVPAIAAATSTATSTDEGATTTVAVATSTAPSDIATSSDELLSTSTATSSSFTLVPALVIEPEVIEIDPDFDPFAQAAKAEPAVIPEERGDCFSGETRRTFGNPRQCLNFLASEPI